jgi:hypothetical protein
MPATCRITTASASATAFAHADREDKAALDVGHDEYWSWQMRDNWEAARDSGINLAFLGSDVANWQIRYEPSTLTAVPNRTVVGYKVAALDPFYTDGKR